METQIKKYLIENAVEVFGQPIESSLIQFQKTRKDVEGDLTLVLFPFVKILKKSPQEVGDHVSTILSTRFPEISKSIVVNGFLNIVLSPEFWVGALNQINSDEKFGYQSENSGKTIMVEYSSPNTNKPLHLGHLRNNFLGYSVAEILKANGNKVIKTQVINDRGIHICKSMLAWERFSPLNERGERETPQNTGMKGDKLVGKYYVEFDKQFNAEAKSFIQKWEKGDFSDVSEDVKSEFLRLSAAKEGKDEKAVKGLDDKIKDLAKNQTSILRDAKEMLVKWEARDPEIYLLWTTMNGWVYEGFESTYKAMGVDFNKLYYESDTYLLGKDIVVEGLEKGIFYQKEDGSVWIDLTNEGLDEKLVLRSDGTAVYMTQDIGTAVDRFKDYPNLNGIIYTVGNEQDYHFKVLFLILKKMGNAWADNCMHLSYGMVDLPTGKMKSREGTVVDADDLMAEVVENAAEMTKERGHLDGMTEQEKEHLYTLIGMGGLKYYLLKVDPKKRMMFNPEESIELNGNTGPFIQYAHARVQSLLSKSGVKDFNSKINVRTIGHEEQELIKQLEVFPSVIGEAADTMSPALIANYTFELVKMYNSFYQSVNILNETDEDVRYMRLVLSKNIAKVIKLGMVLLGIQVPDRM